MEFFEIIQTYVVPLVIAIYAGIKAFFVSKEGLKKKRAPYEGKSKWVTTPAGKIEYIYHDEQWMTAAEYLTKIKGGV